MGLPTTLAGMIGFIVFVAFLMVLIVPSMNVADTENIKTLQTSFQNNMNQSVNSSSVAPTGLFGFLGSVTGLNGVYDFIIGFFQLIISFMALSFAYLGIFGLVIGTVPPIFYVLFVILSTNLIIGILLLIFLSGK